MDKAYNHQEFEDEIYKRWEDSGSFEARAQKDKDPFTIIMPPPNASDPLHVGHAREVSTQDILTRYHRMLGDSSLWLPGADHAGIETQFVFERKLREHGKSRFDFDRETFYQMVWDDVEKNRTIMEKQLRALGASCDWTRSRFTLDPEIVKIVYQTFKQLHDDGLLYRGKRIVNYCPRCGTAFSQLEVDVVEREDNLHTLSYGPIEIATTRPETIFADVAIAVNPKDERYKDLIGKTAHVPLVNREIPIIGDSAVDPAFGTGALKITPGHDATDFEIGNRHKLQVVSVIDERGRMTNTPAKYIGMKAVIAREEVVKDLEAAGNLVETKKHKHTVGICYRDKGDIEPIVSEQWFLKVKELSNMALEAIEKKQVTFVAKKFEKIAKHWLKNLNDWNISRQIVWGIRIPAFRCQQCLEWVITNGETPTECPNGHKKLVQDRDTFDTWFSSGQWPFATLMTTKPGDFDYFYPTNVMNPSYDILPFWVIRMIMLGLYRTGKVPFKEVLLHGLVRDKNGLKISKSKGNVIDPIEMIEKYGADALRVALIWGSLIESDNSLSEENIRGQRNFANKIWNISRFVFSYESDNAKAKRHEDDVWIKSEFKKTAKSVTKSLDKYRLNEAAETIYEFVWHTLADQYLEKTKSRRDEAQATLLEVLDGSLKLLHPFMPFVTEAIWQQARSSQFAGKYFKEELLISAPWPTK